MPVGAQNPATAPNVLRIGLLTAARASESSTAIERGVRLGAAEAKQTANLFGGDVELYEASAGSDVIASATRLSASRKADVLISASADDAEPLSKFADERQIVFLNVASRAQSLRSACRRYTFHVEASDSMYVKAALAGRQAGSVSGPLAKPGATASTVVLWGPGLQRYGAAQINDRFRARYRVAMDGAAWAGWVSVKIASESALRARSSRPARLLTYLESPGTSFDGHKGWPLSFRGTDHQLRQPLYVVTPSTAGSNASTLRDVPELRAISPQAGSAEPARLSQTLERLLGSTAPRCR